MEEIKKLKKDALKEVLKEKGLSTEGTKAELIIRLEADEIMRNGRKETDSGETKKGLEAEKIMRNGGKGS